jgi:hypothetical protein
MDWADPVTWMLSAIYVTIGIVAGSLMYDLYIFCYRKLKR